MIEILDSERPIIENRLGKFVNAIKYSEKHMNIKTKEHSNIEEIMKFSEMSELFKKSIDNLYDVIQSQRKSFLNAIKILREKVGVFLNVENHDYKQVINVLENPTDEPYRIVENHREKFRETIQNGKHLSSEPEILDEMIELLGKTKNELYKGIGNQRRKFLKAIRSVQQHPNRNQLAQADELAEIIELLERPKDRLYEVIENQIGGFLEVIRLAEKYSNIDNESMIPEIIEHTEMFKLLEKQSQELYAGIKSQKGDFLQATTYVKHKLNEQMANFYEPEDNVFNEMIEFFGDTLGSYIVKKDQRQNFLEAIRQEYQNAGYFMHPYIADSIANVIEEPIPITAGIPGLHAEVLAVNNQLWLDVVKMAIIAHENLFKHLSEGMQPTEEQINNFKKIIAEQINVNEKWFVHTYKIGPKQLPKKENLSDISAIEKFVRETTVQFPACHNCDNILKRFCNVVIRTGRTT